MANRDRHKEGEVCESHAKQVRWQQVPVLLSGQHIGCAGWLAALAGWLAAMAADRTGKFSISESGALSSLLNSRLLHGIPKKIEDV